MSISQQLFVWIISYGYLAVFIGSFFEGESVILLAGLLAHQENLFFPLIILVAFLGAITGDFIWFLLGRYQGQKMLTKWKWFGKIAGRPVALAGKNPKTIAFLTRFMYGFRNVVPFSLGMTNLPKRTFLLFNSLGAILWVAVFSLSGYVLGGAIEALFGKIRRFELVLIVVVVLFLVIMNFIFRFFKRFLEKSVVKQEKHLIHEELEK